MSRLQGIFAGLVLAAACTGIQARGDENDTSFRTFRPGKITVTETGETVFISGDVNDNVVTLAIVGQLLVVDAPIVNGPEIVRLAGRNVSVSLGDGFDDLDVISDAPDFISAVNWTIDCGRGRDSVFINNCAMWDLSISLKKGHDMLVVWDSAIESMLIEAGTGDDLVCIDDCVVSALDALLEAGNDGLAVRNVIFELVSIKCGDGNDEIALISVATWNGGSVMGGGGNDALYSPDDSVESLYVIGVGVFTNTATPRFETVLDLLK
jgi:hypothetical protein